MCERGFVCGPLICRLLPCFLAGFVEQLAEGIAEALAGVKVDRWPRARGGFGLGRGFRLRFRGCGRLWPAGRLVRLRGSGLTGVTVRALKLGVLKLFSEEVRNGKRWLGRVCGLRGLPGGRILRGGLFWGFLQDAFERFEQGSGAGRIGRGSGGRCRRRRAGVFAGLGNHGSARLRTIATSDRWPAGWTGGCLRLLSAGRGQVWRRVARAGAGAGLGAVVFRWRGCG